MKNAPGVKCRHCDYIARLTEAEMKRGDTWPRFWMDNHFQHKHPEVWREIARQRGAARRRERDMRVRLAD